MGIEIILITDKVIIIRSMTVEVEYNTHDKKFTEPKNGLRGNIGVSTADHEAGMYVDTDLYGISASLLVDTGATVTIISEKTCNRIPRAGQPDLMSSNQQVFTASGDQLKIVGKGSFHVFSDTSLK